jgi:hypothetical protein
MAVGKSFKLSLILGAVDKASKDLKKVTLAIGAVTAAATAAALKAAQAAGEQQKQEIALAAAMKQAGTFTENAFKHNLNYAKSLQKVTTFGDEQILSVQKLLTNFGIEGKMLDGLTKATIDLAVAKKMDLVAAADLVSKSVGSTTNALTRYGIVVEGAAGSTKRAESAVDNITKIFGGAAQAEAKSYLGQIQQLKNRWGDIVEEIGKGVVPVMIQLIGLINRNILPLFESWSKDIGENTKLSEIFVKILQFMIKIVIGLVSAFDLASQGLAALGAAMTGHFKAAKIGFEELKNKVVEYGDTLNKLSTENFEVVTQSYDEMTSNIINNLNEQTQAVQDNLNAQTDIFNGFKASVSTGFESMIHGIGKGWANLGKSLTMISTGIRDVLIKHFAEIGAEWVAQQVIMKVATLAWKAIEVSAAAAVAAARAAAATAFTLFGAIATGAAIGAAVLAFKDKFANGVQNFRGGLALVGERGPELVNLPSGSDVFSNRESRNVLSSPRNGGVNINIDFSNSVFTGDENNLIDGITSRIFHELQLQLNV